MGKKEVINQREKIEWLNYWVDDANTEKKRIILIGDSVTRECRKILSIYLHPEYAVDLIATSYSFNDYMFNREIEHYFRETIYRYDLAILNIGAHHGYSYSVNDDSAKRAYIGAIEQLIYSISSLCTNNIIVTAPIHEREYDEKGTVLNHNAEIIARAELLQDIARKHDLRYYDLSEMMKGKKYKYTDWVHSNTKGYEIMAQQFLKIMNLESYYVESNRISSAKVLLNVLEEKKEENIYIYGNGKRGQVLKQYLSRTGISIKGFIVSQSFYDEKSIDTYSVKEIHGGEELCVVVTPFDKEIWMDLHNRGINYVSLEPDMYKCMEFILENEDSLDK